MICDGEWIAVAAVAELELTLEVGAPQIVGVFACRQRRALSLAALAAHALDEAVAVEGGVDGADGGDADVAGEAPDEKFADFAGAPVWLFALAGDDEAFDLAWELVGVAHGTTRAIAEGDGALLSVALEELVSGLAGDAEGAANLGHRLTFEQAGDEAETFSHHAAFLPRHRHPRWPKPAKSVTHVSGTKRHLCLRTHHDTGGTQRRPFRAAPNGTQEFVQGRLGRRHVLHVGARFRR